MAELQLNCGFGDHVVTVTIAFCNSYGPQLGGSLRISAPMLPCELTVPFQFLGHDVTRFIEELAVLADVSEGEASLFSFDEQTYLVVSVADPSRGRIELRGRVFVMAPPSEYPSTGRGARTLEPSLQMQFEGLLLDQTFIRAIAAGFSEAIRTLGVSTEDPWFGDEG